MLLSPSGRASRTLKRYQDTAEALLDALLAFSSRIRTDDHWEFARLKKLVEKRQSDLDHARHEFERWMIEELKWSG
jgi:hypothetical protein